MIVMAIALVIFFWRVRRSPPPGSDDNLTMFVKKVNSERGAFLVSSAPRGILDREPERRLRDARAAPQPKPWRKTRKS